MQIESVSFQLAEPLFVHKLHHDFEGLFYPKLLRMSILRFGKDFVDRSLNVPLLDQAIKQYPKFSGPPVLLASWSRKTFPLVASSHIQTYTVTIIDLTWNYILFYQRPQSHIWQCKKQQFFKTGEIQITQLALLVKSQVRLKLRASIRCSPVYPRSSDLVYSVQIFIFQGNYILARSTRHIAQFSSITSLIILSMI